jgi:beta-RFAP synthase
MKLRVSAPSRLHFGLLAAGGANAGGSRSFGGAGLMVEKPGVEIHIQFSDRAGVRSAPCDALRQRGEAVLNRIVERTNSTLGLGFAVDILHAPPPHVGLGTGTQLALAITAGAARLLNRPILDAETAVQWTGRGKRSAIGVHGFFQGGFLVDGGRSAASIVAPLVARCEFPADWRIILIEPAIPEGLSGEPEQTAFDRDIAFPDSVTDRLSRLLLLGALPSLIEKDFPSFGAALDEYNRRVGECFAQAQGGVYAHLQIARIIDGLRTIGAVGVGQSSWGPTVYAIAPDPDQAAWIADRCRADPRELQRLQITSANNAGGQTVEER